MPDINEIILKLEVFQYAMSLNLNIEYYNIRLTEEASNLCMIILPWGKYHYKCLSMGVSNSPENFQQKINDLFQNFEFTCAYIDELLIPTKGYWTDHVHTLELTIYKLKESGLKYNRLVPYQHF